MLGWFKRKPAAFFSEEEKQRIVAAVQEAEQRTSGEVRIYVESHCRFVNPVMRARELFFALKMDETEARNGVLVYVAMKDRQLAIYGDEGIHTKVGHTFWNAEVQKMLSLFNRNNYAEGIAEIIREIGEALVKHFPFNRETDTNELPDDIVFGR
ncbi:MAG: TPM domain-containing protein [Bacteroidetes bacterium]|nr:TPM domain-containing protein [Bacteroidota bacterium]